MKNYYFITGTSSGIGKALTLHILQTDPNAFVAGVSRNQSIYHERYKHYALDLAQTEKLYDFFEKIDLEEAKQVILINNAATLGEIGYVGELSSTKLANTIAINITAPFVLMNEFLKSYTNLEKCIINISSGASQRAIDGWATYCSSKASLNMFDDVINKEQEIRDQHTKVFSVAVGVVDTAMQAQIRTATEAQFSQVTHFQGLKNENQLRSPEEIAQKLYTLVQDKNKYQQGWLRL